MDHKHNIIIVGQGIAGTVLALKLIQKGHSVLVYDQPNKNVSSVVAAGIFNPITGNRMVRTWRVEKLWPALYSFYGETEKLLNEKFFFELDHYRPFKSIEQVNNFQSVYEDSTSDSFIKAVHTRPQMKELIRNLHGGIELRQSGWVDVSKMLASARDFLKEKLSYINEHFDPNQIVIESKSVQYKDINADFIVFCNGWRADESRFFYWLPFKPVKGELLTIKPFLPISKIVNRGVFILPKSNGECLVGSTYDHSDLTTSPTEEAKKNMEQKLRELLVNPYEIMSQKAGIRPSTIDRRPFVGFHPNYETIGVFNGLGTKGISLAPHFADELIRFIEKTGEIDKEANISRYYSLSL